MKTITTKNQAFYGVFLGILAVALTLMPELAAAASNEIADTICKAYALVNGGAGKAVATIAILTLGFMALIGRIQWSLVILVAVGIAIIFAAPEIANAVGNADGMTCV